jgi:CheY-like chemotaxis protein
LIIEDNNDAAQTLQKLLEFEGHEATIAHSGRGGIELARALKPDVVLCDIGLPEMSGFDVARELRAHPSTAKCLITAITGYGQPEDVKRAADAGFDRHLVKPVDFDKLLALLDSLQPE